jgi:hypothetical protein
VRAATKLKREDAVERPMQSYEESGLNPHNLGPIVQTIERHVRSGPAGAFLKGLLLLTVESGDGWYTRKQIGGAVGLEPERCTANVWVSNKLLFEQFEIHRNRLSEALGGPLLALRHRDGNPHEYRMEVIGEASETIPFVLEGSVLRYRLSDEAPQLSIFGKALHPGVGTSRAHYRKWLFLTPFFAQLILAGLAMVLLALTAFAPLVLRVPFMLSNYLAIGGFGALVIAGIWTRWGRLFDDRVLLLGSNDLAGATEGVVLDRERANDETFMVLRRYVAPCPICQTATVRLARGEPEFRRRIVGRCEESPREHVYSFDRVTLEGEPLGRRLLAGG